MSVTYRWTRTATVAAGQVPSTQTDFPVLFSLTSADFATVGNGGHVQNANGYDLNLYSDAALTTIIKTETERYVAASGLSIKWGKWSSLSDGSVRYYGFGDPSITTSQDDAANVWDANNTNVYHLGDGTTVGLSGSTATPGNLTNVNTVTASTGEIYGGVNVVRTANPNSKYLTVAAAATTGFPVQLECWAKLTDTTFGTSEQRMMVSISKAAGNEGFRLVYWNDNTAIRIMVQSVHTGNGSWNYFALTADTNWHHLVGTFTDATHIGCYYDGAALTPVTTYLGSETPSGLDTTSIGIELETGPYQWANFKGDIDEVRVSNTVRTANWTQTTFNNHSAPATFLTLGTSTQIGIDWDASTNSGYQAAASTYSWSHTCAGTNRYLRVAVSLLSVLGTTVTGITYNSVALRLLGAQQSAAGACRVEIWGLAAPATGSNTIAVTLSASVASAAGADSWTYVHQQVPTEGFASATQTNVGASDATVNCTSVADLDMVLDAVATDDTAITVGANQTSSWNVTGALGSGAGSWEGLKTPAGSVTMSWTNVAALATWSIASIALRPVTASGDNVAFLRSLNINQARGRASLW